MNQYQQKIYNSLGPMKVYELNKFYSSYLQNKAKFKLLKCKLKPIALTINKLLETLKLTKNYKCLTITIDQNVKHILRINDQKQLELNISLYLSKQFQELIVTYASLFQVELKKQIIPKIHPLPKAADNHFTTFCYIGHTGCMKKRQEYSINEIFCQLSEILNEQNTNNQIIFTYANIYEQLCDKFTQLKRQYKTELQLSCLLYKQLDNKQCLDNKILAQLDLKRITSTNFTKYYEKFEVLDQFSLIDLSEIKQEQGPYTIQKGPTHYYEPRKNKLIRRVTINQPFK